MAVVVVFNASQNSPFANSDIVQRNSFDIFVIFIQNCFEKS
jgi:hypothetical protein